MEALKQDCAMARQVQARARKPPVEMDLKDPRQIDSGIHEDPNSHGKWV